MDSADYFQGVVKVLEERLGPIGRRMGTLSAIMQWIVITIFVPLAGLAGIAFIIAQTINQFIGPIETGTALMFVFWAGYVTIAVGGACFLWMFGKYIRNRLRREIETQWEDFQEHLKKHRFDTGFHIVVTGEDADKQWPEIKRRLEEYRPEWDTYPDDNT